MLGRKQIIDELYPGTGGEALKKSAAAFLTSLVLFYHQIFTEYIGSEHNSQCKQLTTVGFNSQATIHGHSLTAHWIFVRIVGIQAHPNHFLEKLNITTKNSFQKEIRTLLEEKPHHHTPSKVVQWWLNAYLDDNLYFCVGTICFLVFFSFWQCS